MNKKAQMTLFIILGIVLLIVLILIFVLMPDKEITELDIPSQVLPLKQYVDNCIEKSAEPAIYAAALQGGYIYEWPYVLDSGYVNMSYGYDLGEVRIPSKEYMAQEIEKAIEAQLARCIDFNSLPEFEITANEPLAKVDIRPASVSVDVDYNIQAIRGGEEYGLKSFHKDIGLSLGMLYDDAIKAISKIKQDPEWVDMSYLSMLDSKVKVLPHDKNTQVYSFSDNDEDDPLVFLFASRVYHNKAPVVDVKEVVEWPEGKYLVLIVNATDPEGDDLTFSDDTAMFDISQDGVISFTPDIPGEFDVTISVEDTHLNIVEKKIKFMIRGD